VVERWNGGYMAATLENEEIYTYYLDHDGEENATIFWGDSFSSTNKPTILALDEEDLHFVCFPSTPNTKVECTLTDIAENHEV